MTSFMILFEFSDFTNQLVPRPLHFFPLQELGNIGYRDQ